MDRENTRAIRLPISLPVKARFGGTLYNLLTLNISVDGAFVVSSDPAAEGQLVHLSVLLPGRDKPLFLRGMVIRTVTGDDAREQTTAAGMGIKYYGLGASSVRVWEEFFHKALEEHRHPKRYNIEISQEHQENITSATPRGTETLPEQKRMKQDTPRTAPSQQELVQSSPQLRAPFMYRVSPPDRPSLLRFRADALESGGVTIKGTAHRAPGSLVVVAVVHPVSKSEFHIPGVVQPTKKQSIVMPVKFLKITERTKREFEYFADNAGLPTQAIPASSDSPEREMILYESADETQRDLMVDQIDGVLVEGDLPLQTARDPFGDRRKRS